jgi:hypothetical protein
VDWPIQKNWLEDAILIWAGQKSSPQIAVSARRLEPGDMLRPHPRFNISEVAERVRFELTVLVKVHTLSKRAP